MQGNTGRGLVAALAAAPLCAVPAPGALGRAQPMKAFLLDRRGGTVTVDDARGGGAVFDLWLPVRLRPDPGHTWDQAPVGARETIAP